ncbi:DUF2157 domain-containing protein [Polaribacter sp. Z022]|uniref:DUF2157 domain-containing protein n=1 Tax=Polaribacter sp. Z022 TaxID=2927125 RepID=UPI002021374C|nr:DUF2157 domain-containing protein [Polaribacter sp. Z022]MCL7754919.1 DUF2157 domain-containing protein [Polaribacter sp. Z022]
MSSKIIKELQTLIEEKVISIEVANKIEAYYDSKNIPQNNRLLTVFGVLGSLLVGLGIILVLAHNWDQFSRSIKSILAFLPLVIGQIVVGYSLLKKKSKIWLESSGVFLFFSVGSCISLISQIYNIPGNFNTFIVSWVLLCLPLIYLIKSKGVLLLTIVFSTIYAISLGYGFSDGKEIPWMYLLILSLIIPKYYTLIKKESAKNVTVILNWLIPLSFILVFGTFLSLNHKFEILLYIFLLGLIYNIGHLNIFKQIRLSKNGYKIIGSVGLVIVLLITSSKDFWSNSFNISTLKIKEIIIVSLLLISTLVILIKNDTFLNFNVKKVFLVSPVLMLCIFLMHYLSDLLPAISLNIFILALGISVIKRGIDTSNFVFLNYGLLIITSLIVTRFFDTDLTFVVRGLLFILVGVGFFASNYLMVKKSKKKN